ncbi:hypothetical protein KBB41_03100 [Candidatus Curtissbacteria bacterium]|nr:hypothetical protein [Candidatus Curtissbacteria bacterium]
MRFFKRKQGKTKNPMAVRTSKIKVVDRITVSKRQILVLFSILMTGGLTVSLLSEGRSLYLLSLLLAVAAGLVTVWVLRKDLAGIKYFVLPILPFFFTFAMALFFQLLPERWLTRLPFMAVYGVSIYLIFLNQNVYNIAAIRTIALLRAAHSVGLLFTLISVFIISNVTFSLRFNFVILTVILTVICGLMIFQTLWSFELEDLLTKRLLKMTLVLALIVGQVVLTLSFWPAEPTVSAIVVTTAVYVLLGLSQAFYADRLFRRTAIEYISLGVGVFLLLFLTTSWIE